MRLAVSSGFPLIRFTTRPFSPSAKMVEATGARLNRPATLRRSWTSFSIRRNASRGGLRKWPKSVNAADPCRDDSRQVYVQKHNSCLESNQYSQCRPAAALGGGSP